MARFVSPYFGIWRMITYLTYEEIDKKRWDDCIEHAVNGLVYAWSWYLDVVHPGWEALVEMGSDNYLSVMPITRKRKFFIPYLCQPFFVQQLGVFSRHQVTAETTSSFLHAIPKKYLLIEIRLNEHNPIPKGMLGVDFHRNHLLDLNHDYDYLFSHYHENTRRNLKKSLNHSLRLISLNELHPIVSLFREDRGAKLSHWGDAEYARLEQLSAVALSSSNAFIYAVQSIDNDKIICGALFLVYKQRITFLFSGNSEAGKACQAMTFLLDSVIKSYSQQPMILDFEGSDDDQLARFYHGFGAEVVSYPGYTYHLFL